MFITCFIAVVTSCLGDSAVIRERSTRVELKEELSHSYVVEYSEFNCFTKTLAFRESVVPKNDCIMRR